MEDSMTALAAALRERLTIIADQDSRRDINRHMARLQEISERIEAFQTKLPPTTDPRLKHYLERRSYDKALEWIEDSLGRTGMPRGESRSGGLQSAD
jgi:hypothetical protein